MPIDDNYLAFLNVLDRLMLRARRSMAACLLPCWWKKVLFLQGCPKKSRGCDRGIVINPAYPETTYLDKKGSQVSVMVSLSWFKSWSQPNPNLWPKKQNLPCFLFPFRLSILLTCHMSHEAKSRSSPVTFVIGVLNLATHGLVLHSTGAPHVVPMVPLCWPNSGSPGLAKTYRDGPHPDNARIEVTRIKAGKTHGKLFRSWLDLHKSRKNSKYEKPTKRVRHVVSTIPSSWTPASQGLDREGMALIEQQDADGFRKCAVGAFLSLRQFIFRLWFKNIWMFSFPISWHFLWK